MATGLQALDLDSEEGRLRVARLYRYAQIGHCVNSVTHDVNNFLGAIMAYAELIGMDTPLSEESSRMVEEIMGAVRKSSTLVNNLTAIARKERPNVSLADPGDLVERVVDLRRYDFKANQVGIETYHEPGLPTLMVDRPKLEQALIYLLVNALEELRGREHRLVKVKVKSADGGVSIDVWNTGQPIPDEVRGRMFEPFYTTKEEDHLGLGLALARDLVRLHGGDLTYDPARGFVVYLPKETSIAETMASGDVSASAR